MPGGGGLFKPYNILNAKSNVLVEKFSAMAPKNKVIAEYVWIGGTGLDLRNKTKIIADSLVTRNNVNILPMYIFMCKLN